MTDLPTSLRIPAELKDYLQKYADSQRQKLAPLMIWILEQWVSTHKKAKK